MQVQTTLYQNSGWLQRGFFFVKLSDVSHTLNLELNKLRYHVSAAHTLVLLIVEKLPFFFDKSSNFILYPIKYKMMKTFAPRFH